MRCVTAPLLLLLPLPLCALHVGVSLSLTGQYLDMQGFVQELPAYARGNASGLNRDWPCFYCQSVADALQIWNESVQAATSLTPEFTVLDDGANFTRAMQNYETLAADGSVDVLLGPPLSSWSAASAAVASSHNKVLIAWAAGWVNYLSDFRTEMCPYCQTEWLQDSTWQSQAYNSTEFSGSRTDASIPSAGGSVDPNLVYALDTSTVLGEGLKRAAASLQRKAEAEAGGMVSWLFVYFYGASGEDDCLEYEAYVKTLGNVSTSMTGLYLNSTVWTPRGVTTISLDVVVACPSPAYLGQIFTQLTAAQIVYKALLLTRPSGAWKIYRFGSPIVNYIVEPLLVPTVLPTATDAIFTDYDTFAAQLSVPTTAALQVAAVTSQLTQAWQTGARGAQLVQTMRSSNFETLLGVLATPLPGFRQYLPSTAAALAGLAVENKNGPLNSNVMLVSPELADLCASPGTNSSSLCASPVLTDLTYPMPDLASKYREAYQCPDGTMLLSLECVPCSPGWHRKGDMLGCEPCGEGYYADVSGAAECLICPAAAATCSTSLGPEMQPGYFVLGGEYSWMTSQPTHIATVSNFIFGGSALLLINDTVPYWAAGGVTDCGADCEAYPECAGIMYNVITGGCSWLQANASTLTPIPDYRSWLYWKQDWLGDLGLSQLATPQYPRDNHVVVYAQCPVAAQCAGGQSCTNELNTGLFCNYCQWGTVRDWVFPARRTCDYCSSAVVLWIKLIAVLSFLLVLIAGLANEAKGLATGSSSIALPGMKLLLHYFQVFFLNLDMNNFFVSDTFLLLLRLPLEILQRPWGIIQVSCFPPMVFNDEDAKPSAIGDIYLQIACSELLILIFMLLIIVVPLKGLLQRYLRFATSVVPSDMVHVTDLGKSEASLDSPTVAHTVTEETTWSERVKAKGKSFLRMSDVSFLGDKDKMANNAAYENKRALQKYLWMHQSHLIFAEVTRLFGRVNVVAYILIPILLRALLIPMRCQAVGDRGYMVLNDYPEILCDTELQASLSSPTTFAVALFALPVIKSVVLMLTFHARKQMSVIAALAFMAAGLRDSKRWWSVAMDVRLVITVILMLLGSNRLLQVMLSLVLSAVYLLLELNVAPWVGSHNMVLRKASTALNSSLIFVSIMAAWNSQSTAIPAFIRDTVGLAVTIWASVTACYGMGLLLVSIIYDVFFFKLRVLMAGGAQTGNWTKLLYRCVAWEVGCLKELHLRTEEGLFVLDHSELYRSQRKALVDLLVEIMQQCLQLRGKFRIRNAETVLRIAFEHALRVRKGIIADDFQRYGTNQHALTMFGFPLVTGQDPDLAPLSDPKVTISELETAMELLKQDMLSGDPQIMMDLHKSAVQSRKKAQYTYDAANEVLIWDGNFEDIAGKVVNQRDTQHDLAEVPEEGPPKKESAALILRRLTKMVEHQLGELQRRFETLTQDFMDEMMQALDEEEEAERQEARPSTELARQTLATRAASLPPFERGDAEARKLAMQYAEAHRHALLTAERLLEKAESLEEATNAYYCKAREALMQAGMCQAAKGKRALGHGLGQTKDYFQRAEADFLAAVEALRRLPQPSQRTSSGSGELTVEGQPVPAGLGEFLCAIQKQACVPECEAEIPGVGTMAVLAMDEAQPAVPPATVSAEAELGKEPSLSEVSSLTQPELTDVEGSPSRDPELGNEPGVDSGGVHTLI